MKVRNIKQVTVQGKFRASQSRCLSSKYNNKIVPWLTINGVWLEKLGFNVGDKVNITADQGRIIVEVANDDVDG